MPAKPIKFSEVPVNTYFICGGKLFKRIENFVELKPLGAKTIIFNVIDVDESKLESFSPDGVFEIIIQE